MQNRGQTLLEVIIATGMISFALVAILGLVVQSMIAGVGSKERTQATFIAQDAIEKIMAIRNVNSKAIKEGQASLAWDQDFYTQDGYYSFGEYNGPNTPLEFNFLSASKTADDYDMDLHNLDGKSFVRYVEIKKHNGLANEREVNVEVAWQSTEKGTEKVNVSAIVTKIYVYGTPSGLVLPSCSIAATPSDIYSPTWVTLNYSTANADTASIRGVGIVSAGSGSTTAYVTDTTSFIMDVTGPGGSAFCTSNVVYMNW